MGRIRTIFLGGMAGGLLSIVLAPRLGRRRGPWAALDRRVLTSFSGTPCSQESRPADDTLKQEA